MSSSPSQSPGPESHVAIPAQSQIQPAQKIKGRKGKAGGTGKKGKVFVEDKKDLLSLMSSITSNKDSVRAEKVAKAKAHIEKGDGRTEKKNDGSLRKRQEKQKALEAAKAKLVEKQREKKRRRQGKEVVEEKPAKKRVGFA
ncbi:hypothetical protein CNBG_3924 [Cryptococcus deuterogattii R265]|uniref:Uncharacterized protein n=1 Tax=Cryptococcus deuterogattii (strain R265) TaxID=294750 RepID=A0A095CDI8_CRYD2|nr:hypothetical protein CNBG_3924 [Cryptococcus deuterogattii R265]KIR28117.1 hypothetical protein I309_03114 [Cryptococcus deuterogattii LA55]KIR70744.1 hypothetical protein I310_05595 [Cryptococcus deuterogattii CA1014]KIR90678.1 hypothetical protein I304_05327 [Cryptococcus deuterogattii CBS 10090]KIR97582.1 hypothetical protein L804_05269 [Cryptococcus deuterogattii 2001/935-1]